MADDQNQRSHRADDTQARNASGANPGLGSDPLAELARLIGQSDPFAEFGRSNARQAAPPPAFGAPKAAPPPPAMPPRARQPYADGPYAAAADNFHPESHAQDYPGAHTQDSQAGYYSDDNLHHHDEEAYADTPPARRRIGIIAIAAVFVLAVVGTAGAFGYRALFGASGRGHPPPVIKADATPSKIVPAMASKTPNKLIYDRVADHAQGEKIVSREEQPVEIKNKPAAAMDSQSQSQPQPASTHQAASTQQAASGSGAMSSEPRKIHTIAIRPDQLAASAGEPVTTTASAGAPPSMQASGPAPVKEAPPQVTSTPRAEAAPEPARAPRQRETRAAPTQRMTASANNAPLSLSPNAPLARTSRSTMRTASVAAPAAIAPATRSVAHGGYAVQVSSQRSEADAQASFRNLQAKYPNQLRGRQAMIHKVDLGAKGTYYRAMVGPFASASEASSLCSGLKSAGAQCFIQRN